MNFHESKAKDQKNKKLVSKPSVTEAEEAVKTLLRWAGDDPEREGLIDTPARVVRAFQEWFSGYTKDPKELLQKTFGDVEEYNEMVALKNIRFESYCEHHLAPIIGKVHVAYVPAGRVVGISKIARLVDIFSKRLQVQEKMTTQIANSLQSGLQAKGVAIFVEGKHHCMCTRGVHKTDSIMTTSAFTGCFLTDKEKKIEFYEILRKKK